MAAAQAMIRDGQQAVGIRRQINTNDLSFLVYDVIDESRILMGEAVVVLPPDMGGQQIIQRSDRPPPRKAARHFQPLGVLIEHRIHDVNESLVAGEEAMPAGQQIAFQPALAHVLAQHLHHAAIRRQMLVVWQNLRVPLRSVASNTAPSRFERGLIRAEDAEVLASPHCSLITSRRNRPEHASDLGLTVPGVGNIDRIIAEIRHVQILQQQSAIGVRIRAHAAVAFRGEIR